MFLELVLVSTVIVLWSVFRFGFKKTARHVLVVVSLMVFLTSVVQVSNGSRLFFGLVLSVFYFLVWTVGGIFAARGDRPSVSWMPILSKRYTGPAVVLSFLFLFGFFSSIGMGWTIIQYDGIRASSGLYPGEVVVATRLTPDHRSELLSAFENGVGTEVQVGDFAVFWATKGNDLRRLTEWDIVGRRLSTVDFLPTFILIPNSWNRFLNDVNSRSTSSE